MIQITVWDSPNAKLRTGQGKMTFSEWLESEQRRMKAKGTKTEIRKNKPGNKVALFRVNNTKEGSEE